MISAGGVDRVGRPARIERRNVGLSHEDQTHLVGLVEAAQRSADPLRRSTSQSSRQAPVEEVSKRSTDTIGLNETGRGRVLRSRPT